MATASARRFRADIEGLRAVAVLLVILYHLGVPGFSGGYVGVDVFFVLSGFLITGLLVQELESTGTVALRTFFGRRIRRLLPASALVLVATLGIAWVVLPPLQLAELRENAVATAAYGANIQLALSGTDYLQATAAPSALQHYWSLAVEEQFYVLWPLVLLLATARARRRGGSLVRPLIITTATIVMVSLAIGIVWTNNAQPYAYFLLPARAWEMAAGGLLALVLRHRGAPGPRLAALAGWGGLLAVGVAAVAFDAATAFPGWAALVPVMGTCALLLSGHRAGALQRALSVRPLQAIGKRSYALYLWHWPLFVFAGATADGAASLELRVAMLALTFLLAWASFRLVEDPLRHHRVFARRASLTYVAGAAMTVALVGFAIAVTVPRGLDVEPSAPAASSSSASSASSSAAPDNSGALSAVPPRALAGGSPDADGSPGGFEPSLMTVRDDLPLVSEDGCHRDQRDTSVDGCLYGSEAPDAPLIVLFGDSHAAQWFPAIEWIAEVRGWRVLSLTKSACPAFEVTTYDRPGGAYPECDEWRTNAIERILDEDPELVVVTSMITGHSRDHRQDRLAGLTRTLDRLAPVRTVVLGDTPHLPVDPPVCLSGSLEDLAACDAEGDTASPASVHEATGAVAQEAGAAFIETRSMVCTEGRFPVVIDGTLVYRDPHHLTATFVRGIAPSLGERLDRSLIDTDTPRAGAEGCP